LNCRRCAARGVPGPGAELVFLELADFVAEAARFLEFEVGGGLAHPAFDIADVGAQIVPEEMRALVVSGLDQHPVAPARRRCARARPMVWMSEVFERRKPSLSASRIATSLLEFE